MLCFDNDHCQYVCVFVQTSARLSTLFLLVLGLLWSSGDTRWQLAVQNLRSGNSSTVRVVSKSWRRHEEHKVSRTSGDTLSVYVLRPVSVEIFKRDILSGVDRSGLTWPVLCGYPKSASGVPRKWNQSTRSRTSL